MHEYRRFIQAELDRRGWTAGGLARKAEMHRQTISKILKDNREYLGQMPDESTLQGIAKGFGIDVEQVRLAAARSLAGYTEEQHRASFDTDVSPSVTMTARQPGGLGRGLKYLIPTTDGMSPEERGQALADERQVLEDIWSAATEMTESVLESDPSDRLRAAAQRVVFLLSGDVITRILRSGYAPDLESWLERVYRERQILHERLADSPTPWVQDGISPEDAARSAVQEFGEWPRYFQPSSSGAPAQTPKDQEDEGGSSDDGESAAATDAAARAAAAELKADRRVDEAK